MHIWYGEICIKHSRAGKPARLKEVIIDGFSDDFAAVDFREELCYPAPPKKQNSESYKRNFTTHKQKNL